MKHWDSSESFAQPATISRSSRPAAWCWPCGIGTSSLKIRWCRRSPGRRRFRGATLAWNCAAPAEVDAVFEKALAVGAGLLRRPEKTEYGGYRGYFADPDGHVWEVVQAPGFKFTEDDRLILPE